MFKRWGKNPAWGNESLLGKLIKCTSKETDNIVILRIPIARLDREAIRLRNQNKLFSWVFSRPFKKVINEGVKATNKIMSGLKDEEKWDQLFYKFIREHTPDSFRELLIGLPAKLRNLLKQRKVAYEYIYQKEIPVGAFEKIGEVNLKALEKSSNFDAQHPIRSIFRALLQGTPEKKAIVMIRE